MRAGTILFDENQLVGARVVEQGGSDVAAMQDFALYGAAAAAVKKLVLDGKATKLEESPVGGICLQDLRSHWFSWHSPIVAERRKQSQSRRDFAARRLPGPRSRHTNHCTCVQLYAILAPAAAISKFDQSFPTEE